LNLSETFIQEEENKDRELIQEFLIMAKDVQRRIIIMEQKNNTMKEIADKEINENKSAAQKSNLAY